jgi:hypothetical protein
LRPHRPHLAVVTDLSALLMEVGAAFQEQRQAQHFACVLLSCRGFHPDRLRLIDRSRPAQHANASPGRKSPYHRTRNGPFPLFERVFR